MFSRTIKSFCDFEPEVLLATSYIIIDFEDETSVDAATEWWLSLTDKGGEGMVVKPYDFISSDKKVLYSPQLKYGEGSICELFTDLNIHHQNT